MKNSIELDDRTIYFRNGKGQTAEDRSSPQGLCPQLLVHYFCSTIFSLLLVALFSGCGYIAFGNRPMQLIDTGEVTWIVQQQMAKYRHEDKRRLRLEHSRFDFSSPKAILQLQLSSQEILDLEGARNLLVDFVEDLLKEININPILSSQLASVPFDADQLQIEINFETFVGEFLDPYYIGCVKLANGMARYYAFDMKNVNRYSWHSRVEPYRSSREVSILQRSAEKKYAEETYCPLETFEEMFSAPPECRYRWRF